ncbi:hypothetical protein MRB53_009938 [Persea americana]|uniref:Uncharacterized protein n=1 Tax=Persea americana TaxID=3435 RepID=A0ACC2LQJ3_PERAE|nr:hypothetical protein MRB53_009938 [Persea americana]
MMQMEWVRGWEGQLGSGVQSRRRWRGRYCCCDEDGVMAAAIVRKMERAMKMASDGCCYCEEDGESGGQWRLGRFCVG